MTSAEKDCFALIQQIAVLQDPFCIVCGRPSECGHHLFGRGLAAAFNSEMVRGVCNEDHLKAHGKPDAFRMTMQSLMGWRYEELRRQANQPVPYMDFKVKRVELRAILEGLRRRAA